MRAKKQPAEKMAIKFVEFDQNDEPICENLIPLGLYLHCLLYTSPSPRDEKVSRMPSSA